jgi:hypothetical protein
MNPQLTHAPTRPPNRSRVSPPTRYRWAHGPNPPAAAHRPMIRIGKSQAVQRPIPGVSETCISCSPTRRNHSRQVLGLGGDRHDYQRIPSHEHRQAPRGLTRRRQGPRRRWHCATRSRCSEPRACRWWSQCCSTMASRCATSGRWWPAPGNGHPTPGRCTAPAPMRPVPDQVLAAHAVAEVGSQRIVQDGLDVRRGRA